MKLRALAIAAVVTLAACADDADPGSADTNPPASDVAEDTTSPDPTDPDPARSSATKEMVVETDVGIEVDGATLQANVFRPDADGEYPVLMSLSPYAKDLAFADGNPGAYEELLEAVPNLCDESSCEYLHWETVDPERWVPEGYVVVRVDSRGAGKTPGLLDAFSPQETADYAAAIEWAGTQPWSNGKVGLIGISYYGINQWLVAAQQPEHLAAIVPWEGASDLYRDMTHHGGIHSNVFPMFWWPENILAVQHGNAESPYADMDDGDPIGGDAELTAEELAANRVELPDEAAARPFVDDFYTQRTPDLSAITVPMLSAANWGGLGLHLRGNVEGFSQASSEQKWLQFHNGNHFNAFYSDEGVELQREFLDHFLKGVDNGWDERPPVILAARNVDDTLTERAEDSWPLPDTTFTPSYLDATDAASPTLDDTAPTESATIGFDALADRVVFTSAAVEEETEITGPVAAKLWVSTDTTDADLFVTLEVLDPDGQPVTFEGANDPAAPLTQGWLRLSHRATDPERSTPGRPWHTHVKAEEVAPGEVYEVDVEIWPTSIVLPPGYRLALNIGGTDFTRSDGGPMTGSGAFLHVNPEDRPDDVFGGTTTIHTGPDTPSHLLLPMQ